MSYREFLIKQALVLSFSIGWSHAGLAQTATEKFEVCEMAGDVAQSATEARNSGVSVGDFLSLTETSGAEGKQVQLIEALIRLAYALDGVDGALIKQVAIQMCQKQSGLK